jgi:hypothetical protein
VGPITRRAQRLYMDAVTGKNADHTQWLEYV